MLKVSFLQFLLCWSYYANSQKQLEFIDKAYEPTIKTIQLYPDKGNITDVMNPPVIPIEQSNLVLEFDELKQHKSNFYAKLIHCNYDWTKSTLSDLDFMHDYNEFNITDNSYSNNTHIAYVHYRFTLPPVTIPGNYLLIVYRDGDKNDLVLSKRLMIFASRIDISNDNQFMGTALGRNIQPFNFTLNYSNIEIFNPLQSVHLVMMQNHRWDNTKNDLAPTFIRENSSELEYRFFDDALSFQGGNEFRFVDFRSLNYPGQNTGIMDKSKKPYHLYVAEDKTRTDQAYFQYNDYNGNFLIDNQDNGDVRTGGNYLSVTFSLKPNKKYSDPIYVLGAFNQWSYNDDTKMVYSLETASFEKTFLLKQGLYNYTYSIQSSRLPSTELEGTHFETENIYEIFVYNRSLQPNADLLLGYYIFGTNQR